MTPFVKSEWQPTEQLLAQIPKDIVDSILADDVYLNDRYQVAVRQNVATGFGIAVTHLSIRRIDREPVHDWRDLQQIKNLMCGPDCEAVELYPSEVRKVDAANQYHLWVFPAGVVFPLGFSVGMVGTPEQAKAIGAKQREFKQ